MIFMLQRSLNQKNMFFDIGLSVCVCNTITWEPHQINLKLKLFTVRKEIFLFLENCSKTAQTILIGCWLTKLGNLRNLWGSTNLFMKINFFSVYGFAVYFTEKYTRIKFKIQRKYYSFFSFTSFHIKYPKGIEIDLI